MKKDVLAVHYSLGMGKKFIELNNLNWFRYKVQKLQIFNLKKRLERKLKQCWMYLKKKRGLILKSKFNLLEEAKIIALSQQNKQKNCLRIK